MTHPVQLDVGMLRRGQAQRVDLNKAEGRQVTFVHARAQLPHDFLHRCRLAGPRHARHVQTLAQAVLACRNEVCVVCCLNGLLVSQMEGFKTDAALTTRAVLGVMEASVSYWMLLRRVHNMTATAAAENNCIAL